MAEMPAAEVEGRHWSNLFDLLQRRATQMPGRGFYVRDARGGQEFRTLSQICTTAHRVAYALAERGVEPGDTVLVAQPTGFDFLATFFGLQALGATPVPLGWPGDGDPFRGWARLARWRRMAQRYEARMLICAKLGGRPETGFTGIWPPHPLEQVTDLSHLLEGVPGHCEVEPYRAEPSEVAYIQSTSGTTGAPRGVRLTHQGILASVEAIGQWIEVVDDDVLVSWLPLDNIMGLVGVVCFALHWGIRPVLMHADHFLEHPEDWFWAISEHGGTLSLAPNFAFNYCVRRCNESQLEGLDLSSWRVAMNGSEPVRAQHMQAFLKRFHAYGLDERVLMPVYGLSEATLGVSFHPPGEPIRIDGINRRILETQGRAQPLPPEGSSSPSERMHVVSIGKPLPNIEVRIVDEQGASLPERVMGEIALCGPNLMDGYEPSTLRDDANPTRVVEGWLRTGDLGYMADGDLFFICRDSDRILFSDGRTIFPEETELFVDAIDGVRAGSTAVFEMPRADGEEGDPEKHPIVVAFEVQSGADSQELRTAIRSVLKNHLELVPAKLLDLPVRSVPKTPTGKVRRHHCRRLFEQGLLGKRGAGLLNPDRLTKSLRDLGETLKGGGESIVVRVQTWLVDDDDDNGEQSR
jgi:fatty-acyl-CoA synthase